MDLQVNGRTPLVSSASAGIGRGTSISSSTMQAGCAASKELHVGEDACYQF